MSVTVTASSSDGKVTLSGTKPDGQGTVTVRVGTDEFGSVMSENTNWSIGPKALIPGTYAAEARLDGGRLVTFTLTVSATPSSATVTNIVAPIG
jgi:hypothetical protein